MTNYKNIKGLPVPIRLLELYNQNNWQELFSDKVHIVIPFLNEPMVFLNDLSEIEAVSNNTSILEEDFLAIKSSKLRRERINLPFLDYDNSFYIAINKYPGDDIAIALDYRKNRKRPQVIASDFNGKYPHCEWRIVFDTISDFINEIERPLLLR